MELSDVLPLFASFNGGKGVPNDYKNMLGLFQNKGANPFDMLKGLPGMRPEMMRLFQMMSGMGETRGKTTGGIQPEMLMELLMDGHPQFAQIKMLSEYRIAWLYL